MEVMCFSLGAAETAVDGLLDGVDSAGGKLRAIDPEVGHLVAFRFGRCGSIR